MVIKVRTLILALPLLLSACEGYELVQTDVLPYGNKRTAGSGYAYVLARMLPVKDEPILQAVAPRSAPELYMEPEPPAQDGDEVFRAAQSK